MQYHRVSYMLIQSFSFFFIFQSAIVCLLLENLVDLLKLYIADAYD